MKYDEYKKLSYSLIIQKKGSVKPHPYWQMGHKENHDYKSVYDTYMLSDKIDTQTFVNIFQNPEYYEPQTSAFNEGHVGDKFMGLEDLVRMFVETDVNVTEEDLKKEMTGEGENQTRKFTDKEIKRIK